KNVTADFRRVEALSRLQADTFKSRDCRPIGSVWRIDLHQFRSAPEVLFRRHAFDETQRRRLGVDARVDLLLNLLGRLPPIRKQRDFVTVLNLMDGVIILHTVGLGAPYDPNITRRRVDAGHILWQSSG